MEDTGLTFGTWFTAALSTEEMLAKMIQELDSVSHKDAVKYAKDLVTWIESGFTKEGHATEIEGLFDSVLEDLSKFVLPDMYIGENEEGTAYGYYPIWGDYLYETARLELSELVSRCEVEGDDFAVSNLVGMIYREYLQSKELPLCDVHGNPWVMLFQRINSDGEVSEIWAASDGGAYYGLWQKEE